MARKFKIIEDTVGGRTERAIIIGIFTGANEDHLNRILIGSWVSGCRLPIHAYFIFQSSSWV